MARRVVTGDGNGGPVNIVWFRNDLRVADNAALAAAAADGARVLPVFVLDRSGPWAPGGAALWWLHDSLDALGAALAERGAALVLREGDAATVLPALAAEHDAAAVHCGRAHEPMVRALDERVAAALERDGRRLVHHRVATLRDFDDVHRGDGAPFAIYSPWARASRALGAPARPKPAPTRLAGVAGAKGDRLQSWNLRPARPDWAGGLRDTWTPGEAGAAFRLKRFVRDGLDRYARERDRPGNGDGTSMLSPHLHWGELSPAQVWDAVSAAPAAAREKFENEVLWHDFAAYALWHAPTLPDRPQRAPMARLRWRRDRRGLDAWQRGQTGIPIVDAGMRQLWRIGWMHNRVRMITASFLVKHLLLDWRDGERWFWDTLVDADLATNSVSWQWIAGSGKDSAQFVRVFNPVTQARRFDADGAYVRRWVPELARLPDAHLHAPAEAPADVLAASGVRLDHDYPVPIVDLAAGRERALAAYRALRNGDDG